MVSQRIFILWGNSARRKEVSCIEFGSCTNYAKKSSFFFLTLRMYSVIWRLRMLENSVIVCDLLTSQTLSTVSFTVQCSKLQIVFTTCIILTDTKKKKKQHKN